MSDRRKLLASRAAASNGIVTANDLAAAGWNPRSAPSALVSRGELVRLHPGVFALGYEPHDRVSHLTGMVFACGDGSAVAGVAAAQLWEITRRRRLAWEVCSPHRCEPVSGCVVRDRIELPTGDVTSLNGCPVTTPVRTLADLASVVAIEELANSMHEALYRQLTTPAELRARAAQLRRARARNSRRFREALELVSTGSAGTMSGFEACVLKRIRRACPVPPLVNVRHPFPGGGPIRLDLAWPTLRFCVEVDGVVHDLEYARRRDELREERVRAAGWTMFHVRQRAFDADPAAAVAPVLDELWRRFRDDWLSTTTGS